MGKIAARTKRLQPYTRTIGGKKMWYNGYASRVSAKSAMRIIANLRSRGIRIVSNAAARKRALSARKMSKSLKMYKRKSTKKRTASKKRSATKKRLSTKRRVSSKRKSASKKRSATKKRKSSKRRAVSKRRSGERASGRRNMKKFDYRRPSPALSATRFLVGTKRKGNDGNMWIIKKAVTGIRRWVKM